jgi:hypothetical protein
MKVDAMLLACIVPGSNVTITAVAVQPEAGLVAVADSTGCARIFRTLDASSVESRMWQPHVRVLSTYSRGWVAVLPASVRLLDFTLHETLVIPLEGVVASSTCVGDLCLITENGDLWLLVAGSAEATLVAQAHTKCIGLTVCGECIVVLTQGGLLSLRRNLISSDTARSRFASFATGSIGTPTCACVLEDEHVVIGGELGFAIISVALAPKLVSSCSTPFGVTAVATTSASALDVIIVVASMEDGSVFLAQHNRDDLSVASEVVAPRSCMKAPVLTVVTGEPEIRAVFFVMSDGIEPYSPAELLRLGTGEGSAPHDPPRRRESIGNLVVASVFATTEATHAREVKRLMGDGSARSHCAITVALDSSDLDVCRNQMDVYVEARLVGDLKPVTKLIPIPATCTLSKIQEVAERVFDRRLSVAFEAASGKVIELRSSTCRVFEAYADADKVLVCRPFFPGVPLNRPADATAASPDFNASLFSSFAAASSRKTRGATPARDLTQRPLTPQTKLDAQGEAAMIVRLHDRSQASREANLSRLERSHYPTASTPPVSKQAENALVERLAGKEAIKRRELARAKAKALCMQSGVIVEPKPVVTEDVHELVSRVYTQGLDRKNCLEKALDKKHLFKGTPSRLKLTSKEDWDAWHKSMARDTRQVFRLPEDMMYYGKPSPRDRGRM